MTTDAPSPLHEAAKYMFAALVFAVLNVGLAERCRKDKLIDVLTEISVARERLHFALKDLDNDACWRKFNQLTTQRVTLGEMEQIECSYERSVSVQFQGKRLDTPTDWVTRADYKPMRSPRLITAALDDLWHDEKIDEATWYSSAVSSKFYEWRCLRKKLLTRKQAHCKDHPWDAEIERKDLTVADLNLIDGVAESVLTDTKKTVNEDFSANLPKWSLGVSIYSAARISSLAVALSMVLVAAYVRAASQHGKRAQTGTLFATLLSSPWFVGAALLVLLVPLGSIFDLLRSFPSDEPWKNKWVVLAAGLITAGYTGYVLFKILPENVKQRLPIQGTLLA
jgi:hypothetical protein